MNELAPTEDSIDEITELASEVALPKAEVASPTMEEASEVAAETIELISWAATVAAKARTMLFEKCILRSKLVAEEFWVRVV
jgi:hypothetical protein